MTENFTNILNQREQLSFNMNMVFVITFLIMFIIAWKTPKISKALLINFIIVVIGIFIAGEFFNSWWKNLYNIAESPEDKKWIAHHDGGMLIVGVTMIFKGIMVFGLSFISRKLQKNKSITIRST